MNSWHIQNSYNWWGKASGFWLYFLACIPGMLNQFTQAPHWFHSDTSRPFRAPFFPFILWERDANLYNQRYSPRGLPSLGYHNRKFHISFPKLIWIFHILFNMVLIFFVNIIPCNAISFFFFTIEYSFVIKVVLFPYFSHISQPRPWSKLNASAALTPLATSLKGDANFESHFLVAKIPFITLQLF